MLSIFKQFKIVIAGGLYPYFTLLIQVSFLSCAVVMLFESIWTTSLLLPLSIGAEILAKLLITHVIELFIRKQ